MSTAYRDRVRIEKPTEDLGDPEHEWTVVANSVPCNILGTGGGEMQRGRQT